MTHIFETSSYDYNLIASGAKTFDILNFGRPVTVGDKIIYQRLADTEDEELPNGEVNPTAFSQDEHEVRIDFIFSDEESALKKGFAAVGFKEKEA